MPPTSEENVGVTEDVREDVEIAREEAEVTREAEQGPIDGPGEDPDTESNLDDRPKMLVHGK